MGKVISTNAGQKRLLILFTLDPGLRALHTPRLYILTYAF